LIIRENQQYQEISEKSEKSEKQRIFKCFLYGLYFVIILWLVKIFEITFDVKLSFLGVFPQSIKGLPGILFSPLIHGDFSHLISNTLPLLVLIPMLFYFYKNLGLRIFFMVWLIGNIWLWIMGRESYHIGASGVIYGLAAFLFISGIIRKHPRLMAISMLVAFLYGGMVWGILPIKDGVSWEGHLMGMLAGIILAIFFKKEGPQRKKYSWEFEEEDEEDKEFDGKTLDEWDEYFDRKAKQKKSRKHKNNIKIKYFYKEKKNK